jgi:hypothetical protein
MGLHHSHPAEPATGLAPDAIGARREETRHADGVDLHLVQLKYAGLALAARIRPGDGAHLSGLGERAGKGALLSFAERRGGSLGVELVKVMTWPFGVTLSVSGVPVVKLSMD